MKKHNPFLTVCCLVGVLLLAPQVLAFNYSGSAQEISQVLDHYVDGWDRSVPDQQIGHGILAPRHRFNLALAIHAYMVQISQRYPGLDLNALNVNAFVNSLVMHIATALNNWNPGENVDFWVSILQNFGHVVLNHVFQQQVVFLSNKAAAAQNAATQALHTQHQLLRDNNLLKMNNQRLFSELQRITRVMQTIAADANIEIQATRQKLNKEIAAHRRTRRELQMKKDLNAALEVSASTSKGVTGRGANPPANKPSGLAKRQTNQPGASNRGSSKANARVSQKQNSQTQPPQTPPTSNVPSSVSKAIPAPVVQAPVVAAPVVRAGKKWKMPHTLKKYVRRHPVMSFLTGLTVGYITYKATTTYYEWYFAEDPCSSIQSIIIREVCSIHQVTDNPDALGFLKLWDKKHDHRMIGFAVNVKAPGPEHGPTPAKYAFTPGRLGRHDKLLPNTASYIAYVKHVLLKPNIQARLDEKRFQKKLAADLTKVLHYCGLLDPANVYGFGNNYYNLCADQFSRIPGTQKQPQLSGIMLDIQLELDKFFIGLKEMSLSLVGESFLVVRGVFLLEEDARHLWHTADLSVLKITPINEQEQSTNTYVKGPEQYSGDYPLMTVTGLKPWNRYCLTQSYLDKNHSSENRLMIYKESGERVAYLTADNKGVITFVRPEQAIFRLEPYREVPAGDVPVPQKRHSVTIFNGSFFTGQSGPFFKYISSPDLHQNINSFMGPDNNHPVRIVVHDRGARLLL